ncbi:vitellogenin-2-like isoform X2 [Rhineura floridana]|uniref:vitellogenin-2-like isoform X2 n=1 Tax=Rhineura floridana TaxID=261503 RepID=UPI002AC80DF2|nr:vitellogenin-2-like isoform X2 [Rhineura floridana]
MKLTELSISAGEGCQKNDLEPGFSIAKSFFYTYNGFIQNGLENTDLAKSALKLTCQVKISRVSQEDHILKVLSPQVEEYNGILMNGSLSQTTRLTQKLYVCFAELFKFEYKRGCIGNIYAPKNISIECINIIRGILDLLQITIEKSESVYELQEDGIGGTCHTRYVIQEDKINNKTTISRTKDLNNCTVKVVKNIGMAYIQPCPTCAVNITNTRGTVAFNYKLKYMDTGALITHVDSQQVYAISPFNELGGTAIMDARQNLTLIETTSNQERMPGILLQNYGSLHYQFPQDLPQMALHLIKMNSTESSIVEMLEQLIQQNQLQLHPETPSKFLELIELSRAATHENLESLWKQFADRQQYRSWLLSAVGAAGTTDTFMFLKQRIHNEDLSFLESTVTLTLAFHLTKTNGLILKEAADLMTSPGVQKSLVLHNLAYLAYGSMINRHCLVSSPCPTEILQPLHDLANGAANTTHEEDMVLALKAIGNAGEAASINYIKKFLPEFSLAANALPGRVHIDAVLALRKIARKKAAEIQKILFQIFVNRSLAPKIRIVACVVFFETKPAFPLVTAFASVVQRESNLQVATFAYSHMKVLARGKIPQLDDLSTACRTAIMLLSPRLERMSFRYSRVIHIDGYYPDYRAGAIGRIYLMNNPNTLFPSVIAKIRGYSATSAMDIVEFAFQLEGLADIFKRQDMPFQEYSTYKKIKVLGKLLKGWKELPSEKPLVSTYLKLFSHEIAFALIDKELFEKAKKLVTQPAEKLITLFQKDITGRWTQPILAGELRHTVPTCIGFPLEFGLYTTSVLDVVAQVNGQISPPLTNDFRPDQLLKASIRISADVNSSLYTHMVAVMGINTPHFQTGLEFHAKFHANIPVKFDAKIDMKEEIFKFEITPVQQETELLAVRTKFYAVSRNVDEPNSAKMTPVPPEMIGFDILDQCFKSSENDVKKQGLRLDITSRTFGYGLKEEFYHSPTKTSCPPSSYVKLSSLGYQTCLTMKQCSTVLLGETYLHKCFGECELKLAVKPGAARTKIQLEIQAGSKSDLRLIQLRHTEEEEDNESSSYVDQRAKRKHGKTKGKKEMAKAKKSGRTEQPTFLGHNKPSVLVAVLRTIQNDKKLTMFHLELHADLHSSRPIVQVFVSDLKESKRPNLCAGVSILDPQRAEGYLNWGQDCRDYKIAAKFEYGQYARYPAMQIKVEWLRIPPRVEAAASGLSTLVPGMAYMFGFSQMEQKNPSQQISVVVALTSPRSCAFVLKLHDVTIYDTNIWLPLPLPVGQHTEDLEMQPHVWDFISNVPPSVLENLKGHCSVSRGIFTTFNKVSFNYRMPESCYHVLAHDCSPELKFLVMAKKAKQSNDLKMVRINLVSLEVDMYSSSGLVKLRINGTETQAEDLPYYTSSSSEYILIKHEKNGLLLKAPETGIEKLFYDGHMLKIQVPFWMTGKTCGICGRYDAEYEQEYKMPSGSIATNAVSFAQSWILPDDSCARESAAIAGARTNRH